jgi:stage V sporulation protein R
MRVNGGFPYITVNDADYMKNGELYLNHCYENMELDVKYLEKVLPHVYHLWGRPVHMETKIEQKPVLFTFDGKTVHESTFKIKRQQKAHSWRAFCCLFSWTILQRNIH